MKLKRRNSIVLTNIMATNFMSLNSEKREPQKTVFKKVLDAKLKVYDMEYDPSNFKNILHIGKDKYYGDVFKVWDDDENNFCIFFGTAGDEFKK